MSERKLKLNTNTTNRLLVGTASEMSNLVGMWAFKIKERKIASKVFITGKADNKYFIVQAISPWTGCPNVAKLMSLEELREWAIIPTKEIADLVLDDYCKHDEWRFEF